MAEHDKRARTGLNEVHVDAVGADRSMLHVVHSWNASSDRPDNDRPGDRDGALVGWWKRLIFDPRGRYTDDPRSACARRDRLPDLAPLPRRRSHHPPALARDHRRAHHLGGPNGVAADPHLARPSAQIIARIEAIAGSRATGWRWVTGGGYTPAGRWVVDLADGSRAFAKVGTTESTASWLRTEHETYRRLTTALVPRDGGEGADPARRPARHSAPRPPPQPGAVPGRIGGMGAGGGGATIVPGPRDMLRGVAGTGAPGPSQGGRGSRPIRRRAAASRRPQRQHLLRRRADAAGRLEPGGGRQRDGGPGRMAAQPHG